MTSGTWIKRKREFNGASWSKVRVQFQPERGNDHDQYCSALHQCGAWRKAMHVFSGGDVGRQGWCEGVGFSSKWVESRDGCNVDHFEAEFETNWQSEPGRDYVYGHVKYQLFFSINE